MYPEQRLLKLEAVKDLQKNNLAWYATRFTIYKEIPKNERDYYIDFIVRLQIELEKTKNEDGYNEVEKKITRLQKDLEKKYGEKFIRHAKYRK